jgi:hypothetical protein
LGENLLPFYTILLWWSRLKTNFPKTPQLGKSSGCRVNIPTVTFKQFCQESADADISISDEMAVKQPSEKSTIKMVVCDSK